MRLSLKIALWIGLGATLLVLVTSALSVRRDLALVEQDLTRDARLVAGSIAVACEGLTRGERQSLVQRIEGDVSGIEVDWLASGQTSVVLLEGRVVAVQQIAEGPDAISVAASMAPRDSILDDAWRSVGSTVVVVMFAAVFAGLWVGRWLVGRRVEALVAMARRVARGNFDLPVAIQGGDELDVLASELNSMAGQLKHARERSVADLEARLDAEVQLRHADKLRTVGQLSAGIAHELGTPLNVIAGRAALLLRGLPEDAPQLGAVTTIQDQTARIIGLVRRLMDFARPSRPERVMVTLGPLLHDLGELLGPAVGATIEVEPTGLQILADPELLRQALANLVVNAQQAGATRVLIGATDLGATIELWVEDDGPGVPLDLREHVLEPFFTTKGPGEGTGLGLSIVHTIAEEHQATLSLGDSRWGGARFAIGFRAEETG